MLKNPKYDGCQLGLVSMVYSFFETKTSGGSTSGGAVKIKVISNQNAWFQRDIAYADLKDLSRRTSSDKELRDKAFNIAKKFQNMMGVNVDLFQWFIIFLIQKCLVIALQVVLLKLKLFRTKN